MYSLIEKSSNLIVQSIGTEFVKEYDWLIDTLETKNVAADKQYQERYKRFWAMNVARLSPSFIGAYFYYLEENKRGLKLDLAQLCQKLYEIPTNTKGGKSLQFSFVTKLLHMVSPELPIYDSMVRKFYFLPEPNSKIDLKKRLHEYKTVYDFLTREYRRVLNENLLTKAIEVFRFTLKPQSHTDIKIIDSLIWKFVSMARNEAFVFGEFQHS